MRTTLKASTLALAVFALTAGPAFAGGGCGGARTADRSHGTEVAQIDQSGQTSLPQPAQTPQPATGSN